MAYLVITTAETFFHFFIAWNNCQNLNTNAKKKQVWNFIDQVVFMTTISLGIFQVKLIIYTYYVWNILFNVLFTNIIPMLKYL